MPFSARMGYAPVAKRLGPKNVTSYADAMAESARVVPLRREPQPREPQPRKLQPQAPPQEAPAQEPLWREVLGRRLRALRQDRDETLAETAGRAGLSPQYLSEIERGRKEPSSEMIAALAGALDTTLITLTEQVAGDLRRQQALTQQVLARQALAPQALAQRTRARSSAPVLLALAA
jgi:transcriptional regulator with XRE-family HTH domain